MKKIISLLLAMAIMVMASVTMISCSSGSKLVDDEKTLNVKYRKQGYGTTFLTALASQFEKTFEAEGYKVNVLPAEQDLVADKVMQDIYSSKGTNVVDIFFSDAFDAKSLLQGTYGNVAADITESVWNQKPIKFDKSEEDLTIKDKLSQTFDVESMIYNEKVLGLPYATPVGGLAVNTKVLSDYNLEMPRTTDEMFACAEKLMKTANEDGIFPFTYSFGGNLYINRVAAPWIAQAGGYDEYYKFFSWNNSDGTHMGTSAYEVFGYKGVVDMLEVMYQYFDFNMMAYGCDMHEVSDAQAQIMKGEALFYATGDWMFQEEYNKFSKYRNDVALIPAPMISSLGVELFGNEYPEKCDKILSEICKYALEGKLAEEIELLVESALNVSLDYEDVLTVCERRGMVSNDVKIGVIVNQKSQKKDLAATFLRFISSTEAGSLFSKEAMTQSPYSIKNKIQSEYQWFNGVNSMFSNPYFKQLKNSYGSDYKSLLGITSYFPTLNYIFVLDIALEEVTKYDAENDLALKPGVTNAIYRQAAEKLSKTLCDDAKSNLENGFWRPLV